MAQYSLGGMYYNGHGVRQDYVEAVKWYRNSAEQGDATAQYSLGGMYYNGHGVPEDHAEAVKWYRKAAEQGYMYAQNNLGVMYEMGRGVPQDHILAHMWYDLATSRSLASEKEVREGAEKNRDHVASMMTPGQIAEAQRLAREWKPKIER